jgi:hypothetical protein
MPAGRGKICEACAWRRTLLKRIDLDKAAFASPHMAHVFESFGGWLSNHAGAHRAALTIHRYLAFFMEIERAWGELPTYAQLLERFGAEGLRRVRTVMHWLSDVHGVETDPQLREIDSERRRIRAILDLVPKDSRAAQVLLAYCDHLGGPDQNAPSSLRSTRMALRPAADLLLDAAQNGNELPRQVHLDHYLKQHLGQRAAVTGFVHFLNAAYACSMELRLDKARAKARRHKLLAAELMHLAASAVTLDDNLQRWIRLGLEYFHGVKMTRAQIRAATLGLVGDDGLEVRLNDHVYWLPHMARSQSEVAS